jgi:serine/threonine-protein kinase
MIDGDLPEARTEAIPAGRPAGQDEDRFPPGFILAGRYRILAPIGKGGMGTVYRADDLKLAQPVALKFLPEHLVADETAVQRLYREVRIAREVSHPNVCRTYDLGESNGELFIVMEYVDGEDLASLLRRIGRLPGAKALDVARQLCAGLTAAHERGVLHRDLKPANVMLDGRGRVRITDFGIAVLGGARQGAELWAGTPAYMSPEQLEGEEATARSDIYSLGLILYEVLTGKSAFAVGSLREMRDGRRTLPPAPSTLTGDIDPSVEQAVLRCLEEDPQRRPPSVIAVSALLPGGDPLAAALAAGETPSPEMVAQAGLSGAVSPRTAVLGFLAALALIFTAAAISSRDSLLHVLPLEKPPAVLVDRAREILKDAGYTEKVLHAAGSFYVDTAYLEDIRRTDASRERWKKLSRGRPWAAGYWYRTSPDAMLVPAKHVVSEERPPLATEGMARLRLDPLGRLRELAIVSRHEPAAAATDSTAGNPVPAGVQTPDTTVDWPMLFRAAGLPMEAFHRELPLFNPRVPADHAVGWVGVLTGDSEKPFHIAAASCRGKPVYFEIISPWRLESKNNTSLNLVGWVSGVVLIIVMLVILVAVVFLAWRSLRSGRGDRRAARRVTYYFFSISFLGGLIASDMVPSLEGVGIVFNTFLGALLLAVIIYPSYLVLEPFVRRYWPHAIISWTRLLSGRWRDPMVGRDILVGCLAAGALGAIEGVDRLSAGWLGQAPSMPRLLESLPLRGGRQALGWLLMTQPGLLLAALVMSFLYLFCVIVVKKRSVAAALTIGLFSLSSLISPTSVWTEVLLVVLRMTIMILVMVRLGMLTTFTMVFLMFQITSYPITFDFSNWYAGTGLIGLLTAFGLAAWGAWTAAAGQPLFKDESLQ